MRIAAFVKAFPVLSESFILNQITGLIEHGCEVDVFALQPGDASEVPIAVERHGLMARTRYLPHVPPNPGLRVIGALPILAKLVRRSPAAAAGSVNPLRYGYAAGSLHLPYHASALADTGPYDVVHCHYGPVARLIEPCRRLGLIEAPVVTTFYGYDVTRYPRLMGRHCYANLFRHGDLFLALSEHMRNELIGLGCPPDKVEVHHLGVDTQTFPYHPRTSPVDGCMRVLTVGRLVQKKGIQYGIRAVKHLLDAGHRVQYRIVGDGPRRAELERLVGELGISDHVKLLGRQPHEQVYRELAQAHLFLLPSVTADDGDCEGTPTVILEAMATGLPVLSTHHAGIPEQVVEGETGHLVPERDIEALADRLADLIRRPDRWTALGKAARRRVEREFDVNTLITRLRQRYATVTK